MSISERLSYFRNKQGFTQKQLGKMVGFPEKSADVRLAQYENGTRTPKSDLTAAFANALSVSSYAIDNPPIESDLGVMHTLFALEDLFGLIVTEANDEVCLKIDKSNERASDLQQMLNSWKEQALKYRKGEITKNEYDKWRYNYPQYDDSSIHSKLYSQELSNSLVNTFTDKISE